MSSRYKNWMEQQSLEFITEVHSGLTIPDKFKDHNYRPITLQELEQLDNKFINNPEGGIDGSANNV